MPIITISRQYGSGGSDVALLVAEHLGWQLIDNEFIDRVAKAAELPRQEVEERLECPQGLFDRIARALAYSSGDLYTTGGGIATPLPETNDLFRVTETVIEEAVRDGDVVFVGRGAHACLADATDALHVFTMGPLDWRVERVADVLKLSEQEARQRVQNVDDRRRQYVKQNYGRNWEDPANYDLCINTARISFKQAAEMIVAALGRRGINGGAGSI